MAQFVSITIILMSLREGSVLFVFANGFGLSFKTVR